MARAARVANAIFRSRCADNRSATAHSNGTAPGSRRRRVSLLSSRVRARRADGAQNSRVLQSQLKNPKLAAKLRPSISPHRKVFGRGWETKDGKAKRLMA